MQTTLRFDEALMRRVKAEAAHQDKIDRLEAKLRKKDEVLAELMEEHVTLKKSLGDA